VKDIVASGLARWPNDPTLVSIRANATSELVTRALAVHAGGDVEGARDAAKRALELDPTDRAAMSLASQYERELASLGTPEGAASGSPRVLVTMPKTVRLGEPIAVVAKVLPRSAGPKADIARAKLTLRTSGDTPVDSPVATTETSRGVFQARSVPGSPGKVHVVFEATVDGRPLRAERVVTITS
jgi:hypothetical protein